MIVKCLLQEHNKMSSVTARTRSARFGIERVNHFHRISHQTDAHQQPRKGAQERDLAMNVRETSVRVKEKLDPRTGRKVAPTLVDQ